MSDKKIGMDFLLNAKAANSALLREERQSIGQGLPDGHPLLAEMEKVQMETGTDLEGLPEDHPLILEMKAAEARYEQAGEEEAETEKTETRTMKRAQKLDRVKRRREQIETEESEEQELRLSATEVNKHVDAALGITKKLYKSLSDNEDVLARNRMNAARIARLKRLLYAFERGVSETRMSRV
jgi:hypothetical protein